MLQAVQQGAPFLSRAERRKAARQERRKATKSRAMVNDFHARWLALKNDAIYQCAQGDNYSLTIYMVGFYSLIGLKSLEVEGLAITESEHIDALIQMRAALQETADAESLNFERRNALMEGIEIIEAASEMTSITSICSAWQQIDAGLRNKTISTQTLNDLIDSLRADGVTH